ncbi:gamma-glutamylcyclotransferase family protein [Fodinibius halophilus]|uniref:Gamma-glutamylcyclotransferase n=1 Tax=Fodinibius halophilus TaxID=1736908 RepID=A0A6M1TN03_9BACT|nr:gamma-glutamylcyclotransferase family protein [Fodinibius halophilus]NGP89720.1 gamma-glutamylcyclotransferase [Fodinibius halophilus]
MLYFAYGSNLLTSRLKKRVPSASKLNNALLPDYSLTFNKKSKDGSGKCSIIPNAGSVVHGVIFEIDENEKYRLDRAEGLGFGYNEEEITVYVGEKPIDTFTYIASKSHTDNSLSLYHWYKTLVLEGAREHSLPEDYIGKIQKVSSVIDQDEERRNSV